jgi:hypothetical protein
MIRARDAGECSTLDMGHATVRPTYSPAWLWQPVHLEGGLTIRGRARMKRPRVGQLDLYSGGWWVDERCGVSELTHRGQTFGHEETPVIFSEYSDILVDAPPIGTVELQILIRPLRSAFVLRNGVIG